jgi:hypothetical protein
MKEYVLRTTQYIQALNAVKSQGVEGFDLVSAGAMWCTATLTEQQKHILANSGILVRSFES